VPAPPHRSRSGIGRWVAVAAVAGLGLSSAALMPLLHRKSVAPHSIPKPAPAPPVAPAAAPPAPVPETATVPDEPAVDEPKPAEATSRSSRMARTNGKPAQPKPAAAERSHPEAPVAAQISIRPEPEPKVQTDAPAELPAAPAPSQPGPTLATEAAVQHLADEAASRDAPKPEPPKRPGLLRRTFGRIARPFSKKP
jgi:hypothetical protein